MACLHRSVRSALAQGRSVPLTNDVEPGEELAGHLNRNNFMTSYGTQYAGKRGTYKLIKETWVWVHDELGLEDEAEKIAHAFVKPDGSLPWK